MSPFSSTPSTTTETTSTSSTTTPHHSKVANEVDPRVHNSTTGTSPYGTSNPTRGPNDVTGAHHQSGSHGAGHVHGSQAANDLDPRVSGRDDLSSSSASGVDHHQNNISSGGPIHSSHAANELDPRVNASHTNNGINSFADREGADLRSSSLAGVHHSQTGDTVDRVDGRASNSYQNRSNDVTGSNTGAFEAHPTHQNAHTGKAGIQPVHDSQAINKLDPRVDSDRTTGVSSSDRHHPDQHHPASSRGVGVSPAGTTSHNSTTSEFDARSVGASNRHDHHGGALNNTADRSLGSEHSRSGLNSTGVPSNDRSLGHDQHHANNSSIAGSATGPHLTSTNLSGGAHVDRSTAGVLSSPLGPEIPGSHHAHGHVSTNEYVSGTQHGSTHGSTGGGAFEVNPTHHDAHTGQAGIQPVHNSQALNHADPRVDSDRTTGTSHHGDHREHSSTHGVGSGLPGSENAYDSNSLTGKNHASTISGGEDVRHGNTHEGAGRDASATDKNHHNGKDGLQPVHSSQAANKADPRVDSDRTTGSHATTGTHPNTHSNTPQSSTSASNAAHTASGVTATHKPSMMEKVKGTVETLVGKTTSNPAKVAEGEALKTGHAVSPATKH